jgi:hypothetical protein
MSMTPESKFKKHVIDALKESGGRVLKIQPNAFTGRGWPDLYVAHPFWTGWLELKVSPNSVEALQWKRIKDLNDYKVKAFVLKFYPNKIEGSSMEAVINAYDGNQVMAGCCGIDKFRGNPFGFLNSLPSP